MKELTTQTEQQKDARQRNIGEIFWVTPDELEPMEIGFEIPVSEEDYNRLKDDIRRYGVREPLVVWQTRVVCGNTRLRIAKELNLTLLPVRYLPDEMYEVEIKRYAIMDNLARRHLNAAQKAELAMQIERIEAELAKKRQGRRQNFVYSEYTKLLETQKESGNFVYSEYTKSSGTSGKSRNTSGESRNFVYSEYTKSSEITGRSRDIACRQVGISPDTLHKAKFIRREAPDLWQKCLQGKRTIKEAYKEARRKKWDDSTSAARDGHEQVKRLIHELNVLHSKIDSILQLVETIEQTDIKSDDLKQHLPKCIEKLHTLSVALTRLEHAFKSVESIQSGTSDTVELKDVIDKKLIEPPGDEGNTISSDNRIDKWWPDWCEEVCLIEPSFNPSAAELCERAKPCPKIMGVIDA